MMFFYRHPQATSPSVPLSFPSVPVPDWSLCLCIPQFIPPKSREEERDFFVRTTPIVAMDSFRASYEAIFVFMPLLSRGIFPPFAGRYVDCRRQGGKNKSGVNTDGNFMR